MALRHIIAGVTFSNSVAKALPDIPGVLSLGFWGSGGDGINTNRASGPAFAALGNAPTYGSAFMSVGAFGTKATATANAPVGGQITGYAVTAGGSQYTTPPILTIAGGGGSGATATATVAGGAVTALTPGAPGSAYSSAPSVTVSGGNYTGLDTSNTRAALLAGGWSGVAVARVGASGLGSNIIADQGPGSSSAGFPFQLQMRNIDGAHSSSPTIAFYASTERAFFILPSAATNWRMFGYTYSGGAAGTVTLYNLSDGNPTPQTWVAASISAASAQQLHFGPSTLSTEGGTNTSDIAFGCIASGVLTQTFLQNSLAPAVKSILARRGITVL